jgi:hypothetical protein
MLKIADQIFNIESSEFLAYISIGQEGWRVTWDIEFRAQKKEINGIDWQPHLGAHSFSTQLPKLENLSGATLKLEDYDEYQEPMFLLYIFEHEAVRDICLTFKHWEATSIDFSLSGVADVYADDIYGGNLSVDVSLMLPFDGVVVNEGKIEQAIEKFLMFFDASKFNLPESRGVGCGYIFRAARI